MKNTWKRFGKRIFSWLLCVALVVGLMPEMEMPRVKAAEKYKIYDINGLILFIDKVNNGENNASAELMADLDFSGYPPTGPQFTPIGSDSNPFKGKFNGNGKTIKNLVIDSDSDYVGFFGYVGINGVVSDLSLENVTITGEKYVGGIAGWNDGTIENCRMGGTVSVAKSSDIIYVGGVVGYNNARCIVKNCVNTGTVGFASTGYTMTAYVGGVVGYNEGYVQNSYNAGNVSAYGSSVGNAINIGGVVGYNNNELLACYNMGTVDGSVAFGTHYVGGVVGYNNERVKYCYSKGDVLSEKSGANVGGVAGYNESELQFCYNNGTITSKGDNSSVGGVVGQGTAGVFCCYNMGDITSTGKFSYVGGVAGKDGVTSCYNIGSITAAGQYIIYVGGLTGQGVSGESFFDEEKCVITVDGVAVANKDKRANGNRHHRRSP